MQQNIEMLEIAGENLVCINNSYTLKNKLWDLKLSTIIIIIQISRSNISSICS